MRICANDNGSGASIAVTPRSHVPCRNTPAMAASGSSRLRCLLPANPRRWLVQNGWTPSECVCND